MKSYGENMNRNKSFFSVLLALAAVPIISGCGGDEPDIVELIVRDYSVLKVQTDNAVGAKWQEGDSLTVYTLSSTSHYHYTLASGIGSTTANFNRQPTLVEFDADAQCYALTASQNIYGVSSTDDGQMKLTYKLPEEYEAEQLSTEGGSFLLNVPSWGELTFDANGHPLATLNPLTAFLKVNLSAVPDNTRYILVTTHDSIRLNGDQIAGGAGEPLAGNFDCILEDGATLTASHIFKYDDIIRVALDEGFLPLGHLYIPIVAGHYERLQVVALAEEYYFDYEWKGTLLSTFNGQQFALNSIK